MAHEISGYEGTEKTLEVTFALNRGFGLHAISKHDWSIVLNEARCRILSETRSEQVIAFVLSESSLFIYNWQLHLKTCGSSTLLKCLPKLIEFACKKAEMVLYDVRFSRKNYLFPIAQKGPHDSFANELKYGLSCVSNLEKEAFAFTLGDLLEVKKFFFFFKILIV